MHQCSQKLRGDFERLSEDNSGQTSMRTGVQMPRTNQHGSSPIALVMRQRQGIPGIRWPALPAVSVGSWYEGRLPPLIRWTALGEHTECQPWLLTCTLQWPGFGFLFIFVCRPDTSYGPLGIKEHQLSLHQPGIWASLGGIFLINDSCGRSRLTVGGGTPGLVVLVL